MIFSVELFGLSAVLFAAIAVAVMTLVAVGLAFVFPFARLRDLALRRRALLLLVVYIIFVLSVSAFTRIPPYVQDTVALASVFHPRLHVQQHQQQPAPSKISALHTSAAHLTQSVELPAPFEALASPEHQPVARPYTPYSTELLSRFPHAAFVTFATDGYTDALENLIGSLHVWAYGLPIYVYCMGLSPEHRLRIANLKFTRPIDFNVSAYPAHLRFIHNYAFKPVLLTEALNKAEIVLALDAGVEVRGSLLHVMQSIETRGYFYVETTGSDPLTRVHPNTVRWLGLPPPSPTERMCYGGMQGYKRGSLAARLVLKEAARCALAPSCMDPLGSGHENHRYEQSVISLLLRRHQLHCSLGEGFSEHRPVTLHPNPLAPGQPQTFFLRRWRFPKPYIPHLARIAHQAAEPPTSQDPAAEARDAGGVWQNSFAAVSASISPLSSSSSLDMQDDEAQTDPTDGFFESSVTDRKNSDNKVLQCLQSTEYDLNACRDLLAALRASERARVRLGSDAYRDQMRVNTWVVQRAGELFWYWPLSLTTAALLSATLAFTFATLRTTHRLIRPCAIVGFLLLAALWLRHLSALYSPPTTCTPGFPVHFHVSAWKTGSTPVNPLQPRFSCETECLGQGGHVLTFDALPYVIWVNTRQYAFYSTTMYGHTIVGHAVSIHTRSSNVANRAQEVSANLQVPAQSKDTASHTAAVPKLIPFRHPAVERAMRARLRLLSLSLQTEEEDRVSSWQHIGEALVEPFAFDRPCVFQHNETFYMLPSLHKSRRVVLYTTQHFPTGWVPLKDLLFARSHVDAMLYFQNSVWYLGVLEHSDKGFQVHRSSSPKGPFSLVAPSSAPLLEPRSSVCKHLMPGDL